LSGDPLGRFFLSALAAHRQAGEGPARVRVVAPPRPCAGEGHLRVVAVREGPGGAEWVLAYPAYRRLAPRA